MSTEMPRFLLLILAILTLGAPPTDAQVRFKRGTLTFAQSAKTATLQVEVADTTAARAQGLMHRRSLPENAGMLFIFEETANWGFWMKNTLIPLSIAFIGPDWRIVDIVDMNVAPDPQAGPFPIYQSRQPYRYALEVNQGFFARKGLGIGAIGTYRPLSP
jgi:uncharacterized membrane protein (UPF0127 family)